ncbi:hypothetical protein SLA2020_419060 [Shorea laevis]
MSNGAPSSGGKSKGGVGAINSPTKGKEIKDQPTIIGSEESLCDKETKGFANLIAMGTIPFVKGASESGSSSSCGSISTFSMFMFSHISK